jgi:hypothetical protein
MAKTEGYCTNCGSLINLDDSKEKAECIFCGEVVDTKKAIALNEDKESRLLLQNAAIAKSKEEAKALKEKTKNVKPSPMPASPDKKQELVLKPLPKKIRFAVLGTSLGIIILILAILIPVITTRNANRASMNEMLEDRLDISITSQGYKFNNNRELALATDEAITQEDAVGIYETYLSIYAQTYGISEQEAMEKITVTIYFYGEESGRYVCSYSQGEVRALFETGTPTHSPTPQQTITD